MLFYDQHLFKWPSILGRLAWAVHVCLLHSISTLLLAGELNLHVLFSVWHRLPYMCFVFSVSISCQGDQPVARFCRRGNFWAIFVTIYLRHIVHLAAHGRPDRMHFVYGMCSHGGTIGFQVSGIRLHSFFGFQVSSYFRRRHGPALVLALLPAAPAKSPAWGGPGGRRFGVNRKPWWSSVRWRWAPWPEVGPWIV